MFLNVLYLANSYLTTSIFATKDIYVKKIW